MIQKLYNVEVGNHASKVGGGNGRRSSELGLPDGNLRERLLSRPIVGNLLANGGYLERGPTNCAIATPCSAIVRVTKKEIKRKENLIRKFNERSRSIQIETERSDARGRERICDEIGPRSSETSKIQNKQVTRY
ncbi:hypothetical protein PUN28_002209 [Cardiocondyla obscurior]|uniref:Uncharacterized protein n=1 Tax=Cardiocondyla obscurior TaxID=286306 RepID=A0AAW2GSW2_9HYME